MTIVPAQNDATPYVAARQGGLALPAVIVLEGSTLNRSCLAATLTSYHFRNVLSFDRVEDVPAGIDCGLALFVHGQHTIDIDVLNVEIGAARRRWPDVRTVIVAGGANLTTPNLVRGLSSRPSAVVTDDIAADLLIAALRLADQGHVIFPDAVLHALTSDAQAADTDGDHDLIRDDHPLLVAGTTRQRDVMRLLLEGLSNKNIALRLAISESTVKVHLRAIMDKLEVDNRTQIVARLMAKKSNGHG